MKFFTIIALALPMALSSAAFADDAATAGSVFEHQTDSGKFELTPGVSFGSIKYSYNPVKASGITSATDSFSTYGLTAEYGINDMFSVGVRLSYGKDSFSMTPATGSGTFKAQGILDPSLYLNGRAAVGPGSLRFGANLSMALGSNSVDDSDSTGNEYSGGVTLTPYVGYEMNVGTGMLAGARLSYDVYQSTRNAYLNDDIPADKLSTTGGQNLALTAFYEMNVMQGLVWGADVGAVNHASSSSALNGASTVGNSDGYTALKVETYAQWTACQYANILPTIGYGTPVTNPVSGFGTTGTTSSGGIYGMLAARFAF